MLRVPVALSLSSALLMAAASARAAGGPARLEYSAPKGCPGPNVLRAEVQARLKYGRLARPGQLARVYQIRIRMTPKGALAHMDFTDADGHEATREVSAPTCHEAMSAMALIAALAIEARATKARARAARAARSRQPAPPRATAKRRARGLPPPKKFVARPAAPPTPPPRSQALRVGEGVLLGVNSGFSPKPAPELSLLSEFRFGAALVQGWLAFADSGPTNADGGTARYRLYTLGVEACPQALRPTSALALRGCAGLSAGAVQAAGEKSDRIVTPNSTTEPWLSALALGRVAVAPDPQLALILQGGLGFPVIHHKFTLSRPAALVHRVPPVTWQLGVGILARFE